jgi:putative acyl-CoA dehydrogenase
MRALARAPDARDIFIIELEKARGTLSFARSRDHVGQICLIENSEEAEVRRLVETIALVLQGGVLAQTAPAFVAEAFCQTRLDDQPGFALGTRSDRSRPMP